MAEWCYVLEAECKEPVRKPAGVVQHKAMLVDPMLAIGRLEVIGVKSQNAAVIYVALVEIDIIEGKGRNVFGCDVACQLSRADGSGVVHRDSLREEERGKNVGIQGSRDWIIVGVGEEEPEAEWDLHAPPGSHHRRHHVVPAIAGGPVRKLSPHQLVIELTHGLVVDPWLEHRRSD